MMWSLVSAVLFFLLVPGVVVSLPPTGALTTKAGVHALVFAGVMYVLHQMYGTEHVIGRRGYAGRHF